jgi:hypothetical protein
MFRCAMLKQVETSGWTKPMPLERADMMHPGDGTPEELGQNKPVLLRASVPESHTVYEIVARMEMVGGVFSRTMVRWLLLTVGPRGSWCADDSPGMIAAWTRMLFRSQLSRCLLYVTCNCQA